MNLLVHQPSSESMPRVRLAAPWEEAQSHFAVTLWHGLLTLVSCNEIPVIVMPVTFMMVWLDRVAAVVVSMAVEDMLTMEVGGISLMAQEVFWTSQLHDELFLEHLKQSFNRTLFVRKIPNHKQALHQH